MGSPEKIEYRTIVRIYAESDLLAKAENLAKKIINDFKEILNEKNAE